MEFVGEPETKWSFWLGFSEHLSADQLEPEITQYDEGPVQNSVDEELADVKLKNEEEEELYDGINF